jgi:hypothetical protein
MTKNADGTYTRDDHKVLLIDTIHNNSVGNYWDAITRTGLKMQHAVSVTGGNDVTQYLSVEVFTMKKVLSTPLISVA